MSLPKPYYQDSYVTIYHGDCREILPELSKVDLVLTDPPYGIDRAEWDIDCYDWIFNESLRVLRDGCFAFVFSSKKNLVRPSITHDIFAVTKNFAQYRHHLRCIDAWYPIIYFPKGKLRLDIKGGRNTFMLNTANTASNPRNPRLIKHETPKDINLFNYIVSGFSNEGDMVLDMFLGSGTTALACLFLNRRCIGIEIEEKYCEIAARRCSQGVFSLNC